MHHSEEFISKALLDKGYGEVSEIKFIKKTNFETGKDYNGAIVKFKYWFDNTNVKLLFDQMNGSFDRTARLNYDHYAGTRFWIVCQHKSSIEKVNTHINTDIPDKERIQELEKLVASMTAQMHFMQSQQEKTEQKFMDYEQKEIHSSLVNADLRSQMQDKELEIQYLKRNVKNLTVQVDSLELKLEEKKIECDQLKEELYEETNILAYVNAQANEMRDMLKIELTPLNKKMTIEELID